MRNFTLLLLSLIIFSFSANSQSSDAKRILSAGLSLGLYGKYYNDFSEVKLDRTLTPPVSIQFETRLKNDLGLGEYAQYITVGVFAGFHSQDHRNEIEAYPENYEAYKKYLYLWGGVSGSFHAVPILIEQANLTIDPNKWDLYVSLKSGVVLEKYKSNYYNNQSDIEVQMGNIDDENSNTFFYIAPVIGGRYYFTDMFAAFVELGRNNLSNLTFGGSMRF